MADRPYATPVDVEKILSDPDDAPFPETPEYLNLETVLLEATDLVEAYLGREYVGDDTAPDDPVPEDVPGGIRRVTARVALRAFIDEPDNPGAESEVQLMGPFSHTINWSKDAQDRDLYLTDSQKLRLDKWRVARSTTVRHMPMAGAGGDWYGA